ncbi:MAG: hypothetical protein IT365_18985 [Candidatus Hydrogenedentes bacterium]|nr:hypothetical protein [Candidatus Hydrogenedentota bacterium]
MRSRRLIRIGASVLLAMFATAELHEVLLLIVQPCASHSHTAPGAPQPQGTGEKRCAFCALLSMAALIPFSTAMSVLIAETANTDVPTYLSLRWSDLSATPESLRGPPLSVTV